VARSATPRGAGSRRAGATFRTGRGPRQGASPVVWWLLILAALAAIVAGGYATWRVANAERLDASLCPEISGPSGYLLILLDLTDPVEPAQASRIRGAIEDVVDASPQGTMTALGVVSTDAARMGSGFALCKPRSARDAGEMTENRRMVEERYRKGFAIPLERTLDAMLAAPEEDASPIMEGIQALAATTNGFLPAGERHGRLIVVSDLLQNSDAMSFYRGEDWSDFEKSGRSQEMAQNLDRVEVDLMRIARDGDGDKLQAVREFWQEYFTRQGAGRIRETVVGGL
jgi:hypothetical protein